MNIAVVEKAPSKVNYKEYFDFDFDVHYLCETNVKRVLKKDIVLDIEKLKEDYDFLILVGADACKHVAKISSVTKNQGYLVEGKYLPLTNPAMLLFKPDGAPAFHKAVENIKRYIEGDNQLDPATAIILETEEEVEALFNYILENKDIVAADTETSALYTRKGFLLGISVAYSRDKGYYIPSDIISEKAEDALRNIAAKKKVIFHNGKFDRHWFKFHLGVTFSPENVEDTMLMHYALDERVGTHGLKELAIKYTGLGDYDRELDDYKREYCKKHGIKQEDFSYEYIPTEILGTYAAIDAVATFRLYQETLLPALEKNDVLYNMYRNLLIEGSFLLQDIEDNGVPFSRTKLVAAQETLNGTIEKTKNSFYDFQEVIDLENAQKKEFNPNSVQQLRELLFTRAGLPIPKKRTEKGAISTDATVLEALAKLHKLPKLILEYKKAVKLKSTYIDKALANLDADERLRTFFNLTTTTSGRLSSSGTLNMQQIPRDDKLVKSCISAREGYVIVSQDLATAEMYVVAVLSGDKELQKLFKSGGDFHSATAKLVFNLDCKTSEVKEKYPDLRQAAKSVSFGILYGSGPAKVAEMVGCSVEQAIEYINAYFKKFSILKRWLDKKKEFIKKHGFVYSFFGRKRRLYNVFSKDKAISSHEVRSGVNALVQGPASDINLLAAIEMNKWLKANNMKSKIFALVHDSIVAEVAVSELDIYTKKLKEFTQKDRGLSIPGCPIGIDVEIGTDYSFKEEINV